MTIIVMILAFVLWSGKDDEAVTIRFLDVGQGDAILLSQGSLQVLIDGGKDPKRLTELLGMYMPFWDKTIDAVVATHPDEDHIGGLVGLSNRYYVGKFLQTNSKSDTQVFSRYNAIAQAFAVETFAPLSVIFPNGARLETVYPEMTINPEQKIDSNETSIVMQLRYGDHSFLFTGDLPDTKENEILIGDTDVLKVGHHGSKNSTSDSFLDTITPEYAIISVGSKNRYGHPTSEVLERLQMRNISVLRTDEEGTIMFTCRFGEKECEIKTER